MNTEKEYTVYAHENDNNSGWPLQQGSARFPYATQFIVSLHQVIHQFESTLTKGD